MHHITRALKQLKLVRIPARGWVRSRQHRHGRPQRCPRSVRSNVRPADRSRARRALINPGPDLLIPTAGAV